MDIIQHIFQHISSRYYPICMLIFIFLILPYLFLRSFTKIFVLQTAMEVGQIAVAGGAVLGMGALCYYGLGMSNEPGAIDRVV